MKFSFIIPVYNCKEYLPDCVDSIRAVGAEDYEILLIDDGSTDGSGEICDELARQFPEVQVVHQANAGASAARNRGLQVAIGELVLFIDADDSIDSAALGKILSDPRCQESDLTIFGLTFDYYHNGKCYRRDPLYFDFDVVMNQINWSRSFLQLFRDNSLSPIWNKAYKREIIQKNGLLLDTSMFLYEDFEFVLRYLRHCDTIWNVPQAIYHYRQSEDESNARRRLKRIDSISNYLQPIEDALSNLPSAVSKTDRAAVMQLLYMFLARDKVIISGYDGIQKVCLDFRQWIRGRELPLEENRFQRRLREEKVIAIYLSIRKSLLRHKLAVRVKSALRKFRNQ